MSLKIYKRLSTETSASNVLLVTLAEGVASELVDGLVPQTGYTYTFQREVTGKTYDPVELTATTLQSGTTGDTTAPQFSTATVTAERPNVLTIQLQDDNPLAEALIMETAFALSGLEPAVEIRSVIVYTVEKQIELFLSRSILEGEVANVAYTKPTAGDVIKDTVGNEAPSFLPQSVTNLLSNPPDLTPEYNLIQGLLNGGFTGGVVNDSTGNNNHGALVKSNCLTSDGTLVLTFANLTGVTVTSKGGTASVTVSGNTLTVGAGTLYNLVLSNGKTLPIAEGFGNTVHSTDGTFNATLSGTVTWSKQDAYHYNITSGFTAAGLSTGGGYCQPASAINITGAFDFEFKFIPNSGTTTHELIGSSNTAAYLNVSPSAVLIKFSAGVAQTFPHSGYTVGQVCTVRVVRDYEDRNTIYFNGVEVGTYTDALAMIGGLIGRAGTSTGSDMKILSLKFLSAQNAAYDGKEYIPSNNFGSATYFSGFGVINYPNLQGGMVTHTNQSGAFHNAAETLVKPNPNGNAALNAATGYTSATELSYAGLKGVVNPVFVNTSKANRYRSFVVYDSVLPYEQESTVKNYVAEENINLNVLSGFSSANYFEVANGSDVAANDTDFTVAALLDPQGLSGGTGLIVGKTNAIDGTGAGWYLWQDNGKIKFSIRNGASVLVHSRDIAFMEKDLFLSLITVSIKDNKIYISKNGVTENTVVNLTGVTATTHSTKIGSLPIVGTSYPKGIAAVYLSNTKGLTEAEHEAFYQEVSNNAYTTKLGMTRVFAGENGNANMLDRVGGSVVATKNGTITAALKLQKFNVRYRPENYANIDNLLLPEVSNTTGALDYMATGDSITNSLTGTDQIYAKGLGGRMAASADMTNYRMVGSSGTAPYNHRGFNGSTADTHLSSGGSVTVTWSTDLTNHQPDLVTLRLGINASISEVLMDRDVIDLQNMISQIPQYATSSTRIGVLSILEHADAFRRARAEYLNYQLARKIVPLYQNKGFKITFKDTYRVVKHMNGDFADEVHPNDQGYNKLIPVDYQLVRNIAGKS